MPSTPSSTSYSTSSVQFGSQSPTQPSPAQVVGAIDHTKLTFKPGENETESIEKLCQEAKANQFFAVCVRPRHIGQAKSALSGTPVKVATVIGFPPEKVELSAENTTATVGNFSTASKVAETRQAVLDGVEELDLVLNVNAFKQEAGKSDQPYTSGELSAIKLAANGVPIKVIIETDLLNDAEIVKASQLCHQAGVFMVKTCTGMVNGGRGATVPVVQLIRKTLDDLGSPLQIKASGGVKTLAQGIDILKAGANRIGTSSGVEIKQGIASHKDY
ncbi:MAG: deoxyribose-phosphate aldolase [Cyanobacteria bacterium]|nr:deoxyribose-phosphate aldolase [Cyanobacteriota bacterium]